MKTIYVAFLFFIFSLVNGIIQIGYSVTPLQTSVNVAELPDDISKIVNFSCMPCHSSQGGLLSRGKLNFTTWPQYSQQKQKEKAEKIYSVLKKGVMPPKSVRENRPEIIPTKEQVSIIKEWADSLEAAGK
jgi:hypothetical protein